MFEPFLFISYSLAVPIEIEKKYRLTKKQREQILLRLKEVDATPEGEEFEENTLFTGDALPRERCVLRLRRVNGRATLTFKQRIPSGHSIKHQHEDETTVGDADAMEAILDALGLTPRLVYEKRRATWQLGRAEIVIDELPFGLFMEIEGTEAEINDVEKQLAVRGLKAEHSTYPQLTQRHGKSDGQIVEARFPKA